ncbi:hypothetical protein AMS68_006312 [Peltaster fructicola]|uniref:Glycolipid transfer protein domain-containing protein n=1 Tax=Peltaster fructicola TaxID=286661 RepID=A0A6H0Y1K2_9PEZI|nr:hypothetical protein AMS68_006312 [Peltaster fructicola]
MAAYPPGGTYFDGKKSFTEVPIESSKGNGIATGAFLDASEVLVALFDVLGSVAFKPVKGDLQGNIKDWSGLGLDFTAQALRRNIDAPSEELSSSFREAYGTTLKPHHSFLVKPIFSAAMGATPYRKDFYAKLGDDQTVVNKELNTWVAALEERLAILKQFLSSKEAKY